MSVVMDALPKFQRICLCIDDAEELRKQSASAIRRWANGVVRKWGRTDLTGF